MAGEIVVQITGLDRLVKKLGPGALREPFRKFFERCGQAVKTEAQRRAPVDTGRLRASIAYEIGDESPLPRTVRIGSRVHYAPYMEYGTARQGDPDVPHRAKHWPPAGALDRWAYLHGIEDGGGAVAEAIGKRGGLKPRRYLRGALSEMKGKVKTFASDLARDVKIEFGK